MNDARVRKLVTDDFPFLTTCRYFDSASVCPPPRSAIEAMATYYAKRPLNYGVGAFAQALEVVREVDKARESVARFVGASPDEIVFTKNTTEAINTVARGIGLAPGDCIVLSTLEHQSNVIPWLREAGAHVEFLTPGPDGRVPPSALENILAERPVRLVAITHVSNVLGTVQDVTELVATAKRGGAITLVDAAQSAGRVPIDVGSIDCDFAAFCGRKALMGPQGTGFLYGRKELLENLSPLTVGSRAGNLVDEERFLLNDTPYRFEAGILNTAGVLGLARSVGYLTELGMEEVARRVNSLACTLLEKLSQVEGVVIHSPGPADHQAGIISWSIPGIDPHIIAERLFEEAAIAVTAGRHGSLLATRPFDERGVVRASVHWFNLEEEMEFFASAVRQVVDHLAA